MNESATEQQRDARNDSEEGGRRLLVWLVVGMAIVGGLLLLASAAAVSVGYTFYKEASGSMKPTIRVDEHVATLESERAASDVEPGDIVIYDFPQKSAKRHLAEHSDPRRECAQRETLERPTPPVFMHRLVALEGQTIEMRDNQLYVDDDPVRSETIAKEETGNYLYPYRIQAEETLGEHTYRVQFSGSYESFGPLEVPDDHVFVIGDNRDNSSDSRCWGPLPESKLRGRALHIIWSTDDDGIRPDRIGHEI